jgi:hypothetical protein
MSPSRAEADQVSGPAEPMPAVLQTSTSFNANLAEPGAEYGEAVAAARERVARSGWDGAWQTAC